MSPPPASPTAPSEPPPKPNGDSAQDPKAVDSDGEVSSESGEASSSGSDGAASPAEKASGAQDGPPLPNEPAPDGPPLPNEPAPTPGDDGWDCQWDSTSQAWFFHNRFTGQSQWDNPRVQTEATVPPGVAAPPPPTAPLPPDSENPVAGGYNPAIHGDYDPNAWYAKGTAEEDGQAAPAATTDATDPAAMYGATATFNRFTGQFQTAEMGPERHNDEAKSKRQMNAFFDVDAAANSHDGRSLKAERSNKKPSKAELKAFKEKRRVRKEEKRRAWLLD